MNSTQGEKFEVGYGFETMLRRKVTEGDTTVKAITLLVDYIAAQQLCEQGPGRAASTQE